MKRLLSFLLALLFLFACIQIFASCNNSSSASAKPQKESADEKYYILNTSTKKYHLTNCSYLPSAENSKKVLRSSKSAYREYSPCQHCKPY